MIAEKRIIGQVPICCYPVWKRSIASLLPYIDELYVRLDGITGDLSFLPVLQQMAGKKLKQVLVSYKLFDTSLYREEMVRALDIVRPDIVVHIDSDEVILDGFEHDLEEFITSGYTQMMMQHKAPMPTEDGSIPFNGMVFPGSAHVKAYKWREGLSFVPYCGYCSVTQYNGDPRMTAGTRLDHYAFWNEKMMSVHSKSNAEKVQHSKEVYDVGD